jgi:tetratricopeptide (TPR) repeat protein
MNRSHGLLFALLFGALVVPADVMGQNPKDDRYTREASKHLGVAMLRQDEAERNAAYQAALMELQEGMVREASNPKIWFLAGQAYAGLLDFAGADSAFDRAVEMYPEYEAEVEAEREVAWVAGFQQGVALMDQQQNQEALRVFQAAHDLYPHRPEALLNMGSLYANAGETDRAIQAFEEAIAAVNGPRFGDLDEEGQQQWKSYEQMSLMNIAQMVGHQGVEAFQADDYDLAAEKFEKATESNPHSRDFLFNIVQAHFGKATALEEQRDSAAAPGTAPQDAELIRLYEQLQPEIAKVQEYDPANESLLLILARAKRRHGTLTGNEDKGQQDALAVLTELQNMPATVADLLIQPGDGTAMVEGSLRNNAAEAGTPVRLQITLLGLDGTELGTQEVTVTAPERDASTEFQATVPNVTQQIAGWKYRIMS